MIPLVNFPQTPYLIYFVSSYPQGMNTTNPTIPLGNQPNQRQTPIFLPTVPFQNQNTQLTPKHTSISEKKKESSDTALEDKKPQIQREKVEKKEDIRKTIEKRKEVESKKRPVTYLTERAFYMKQKIKGRVQNSRRMLRKREKGQSQKLIRGLQKKEDKVKCKKQKQKKEIRRNGLKKTKLIRKVRGKVQEREYIEYAKAIDLELGKISFREHLKELRMSLMKRKFQTTQA